MDKIIDRLKKVYALALKGVPGGEREAAQSLLDKLMKKYGVSISDLEQDKLSQYDFEYHGTEQRKLLVQTIYKVIGNIDGIMIPYSQVTGRMSRTKFMVKCNSTQAVEIRFLFDFYSELWEREKELFFSAYVQKHRIFGIQSNDDIGSKPPSAEDLAKIIAFMQGLSDETPMKQLKG